MDCTNIIGEKIKSLRTNQEISIQELAERAGLTVEQVSRIEENIDIPSLAPLIKIARALGVRLGTFLDDQTSEAGPVICRKGEADDTIGFSNNATHARQHMHYHSLSKSKVDRHMEPFIIDIDANDEKDFFLSAHEGEEFIMVLKGELEISYGKNNYRLKEGDTIYYDSIVPHTHSRRTGCTNSGRSLHSGISLTQIFNDMLQLSERTLGDWLEHWAEVTPDKEYIVYSDRNLRFTWKQFNERVDHMAKGLLAIGVKKDTHVGIWARNVPDWLTFLYACAKIGAVAVTVNTNYKQAELEYLCENSDMHTLCIVDGEKDSNFVEMTYTMLPELKLFERGHMKSKRFPHMRNVVYIGQEKYRGMYNTAEILLLGSNIDDEELIKAKKLVSCHDTVNMQYTSGTTGFPKGVMLTHYNIANNGFLTGEHMKFTADDKLCVCVPLFHCFGVVLATMNCLTHGCTQVMIERFDPLLVLASIHKERCTALYGVPTMFIAELHHPMFPMFDLSSLRTGIMAGSLCPVELMKQVEEKMFMRVTSVYGLTEASPGMTHSRIDDDPEVRYTTVGHDFEFTEVKVIDPTTGEECPVGVQGEMCNRGYNTMKGYYKNPEATAEVIDANGFLHSGDLGVKDENGNYRITGRIKDMIIRGGENIYPREIEEFLYKMPGIKDVQVAGVPSKKYGEAVGAFIILHEGYTMNEFDVREFCQGKIARYKIPKYIFFVKEFPMTGSGKIQKFKLKDLSLKLCAEQGIEII